MKGLFVLQPGQLSIEELPQPVPGPFQALVKTEACAICNSTDTKLMYGEFFLGTWPLLLGHETIGRIVALGDRVRHFNVGDRVLRGNLSDQQVGVPGGRSCWGGFAEYTLVTDVWARDDSPNRPESHAQQVVPAGIDPVEATALIMLKENLSLLYNSDVAGRSVAIVGTGPAAQAETIFARALGAQRVVVFGRSNRHAARFSALGADEYMAGDKVSKPVGALLQAGGFDRVFEAVGSREALAHCLELVSANGTVCVYGIPPQSEPYSATDQADPRVTWPKVAEAEANDHLLKLVASGEVHLDEWISHVLPWQEFQQGFDLIWGKVANKVVLTFD